MLFSGSKFDEVDERVLTEDSKISSERKPIRKAFLTSNRYRGYYQTIPPDIRA